MNPRGCESCLAMNRGAIDQIPPFGFGPPAACCRSSALLAFGNVGYTHQRRRPMKKVLGLSVVLAVAQVAHAADIEEGKEMAATVCAACHGANGVSVSDTIPNLAAQRTGYLEAQLKAFKDGTRKQPGATSPTAIMNAIATQLSAENIANVAAYFASQPGAATGARSALLPNVANTRVTFPEGYKDSFTKYHTINFPATRQVRYYYANSAAVAAAKAGKPLPDGP